MHPYLAEAPGLVHVEYPQEDIQALSWDDGTFDLVLTSETLEHVPDPRLALRETRRVLRPGGRHVFTVPSTRAGGDPVARRARARAPRARAVALSPSSRARPTCSSTPTSAATSPDVVRAEGFDVATDGEGVELVVVATRPPA